MRYHNIDRFRQAPDRPPRPARPQSGVWFVTIRTHNRECVFGRVEEGRMKLSPAGEAAVETWEEIAAHYPGVRPDAFVVMPNHVHGIIRIMPDVDAAARNLILRLPFGRGPLSRYDGTGQSHESILLALVIGYFRATTVERVNRLRATPGTALWERSYCRRAVHDDADLTLMCEYIWNNPEQWEFDRENPDCFGARAGLEWQNAPADTGARMAV